MDFTILGAVSAASDGHPIALAGGKQRTVLAALLLARGGVLTDERLTTLVWGWEPPPTSTSQLYTYVSRLRTRMGSGIALERSGSGYRMDIGEATLDWDSFRALAEAGDADLRAGRHADAERRLAGALALWKGPALTGVTEQLALAEAPRMEEARLSAVEHHAEAALALGRHAELVPGLTRQVALHPLRERLRGHLMTALYRCGRQPDALELYEEGRRTFAEELGIDPGTALRTLHEEMLGGTLVLPAPPELVHSAPAGRVSAVRAVGEGRDAPVPALLPAPARDFTGRDTEVDQVIAALHAHQYAVVTGAPGTGKSALALHTAGRVRDAFPDGQLYADLRTDGGAREPREVLGWFLRALGSDPDRLPATVDERAQLYRTLLAGRRMLIVLDNATDDAQVRPLLPGCGESCTVVTGGRPQLASLEGIRLIRLGPLSPGDAVRLLAAVMGPARIGEDPEAIVRIAEFCDRLPLALRIAAARLVVRPQWSTTRFASRLEQEERRLAELRLGGLDVGAGLRRALDELPPRLAEALVTLAADGPRQLTAPVAATVLGTGTDDAEELLEQLSDSCLLDGLSAGRSWPRYRFPPLVRLFGRELSRPALLAA
ncbi:BTAD domain-containing putative transcriptional regulator [Streptomyces sp. PTY087I2]|uniref:AfsR/SARP family transcriptional regulator n=1 Tax=Streptomyces sp. PTY087I2 TaxID=1819298 RepID=UPI00080B6D58|nr:BTAD domain-containing putative transcriptional regulator [Streptomyces sp. PTY087I2]OCC07774.1 Regulatory protein AfsR [Streptomyces sp. PTY087I2]